MSIEVWWLAGATTISVNVMARSTVDGEMSVLVNGVTHIGDTTDLTSALLDATGTIKVIFSLLGQKKDLFKNDTEMKELMDNLATFVLSPGVIKLGIMSNE